MIAEVHRRERGRHVVGELHGRTCGLHCVRRCLVSAVLLVLATQPLTLLGEAPRPMTGVREIRKLALRWLLIFVGLAKLAPSLC